MLCGGGGITLARFLPLPLPLLLLLTRPLYIGPKKTEDESCLLQYSIVAALLLYMYSAHIVLLKKVRQSRLRSEEKEEGVSPS